MVFGLIAGLLSLATSSIAYIFGAFLFAKSTGVLVAFLSALVIITVIIFIFRALFSDKKHNMNRIMQSMHVKGHMKKLFASRYEHAMERKLISGSVARIIAFGTIVYLTTESISFAYMTLILAAVVGTVLVIARRHKFSDLTFGVVLGFLSGFFSLKFVSFIMGSLGI